jgi:peptidoglycan/xylan/chitin deacetylase (PgdA/CDA1 family)
MRCVVIVSVVLVSWATAVYSALPPDVMIARFRNDCKAAVSLTFDDALRSHVETAMPILDRYGLKGTFFLLVSNVGPEGKSSWDAWRRAVANGHEAGSHSLTHPLLTKVLDDDLLMEEIAGSADVIEAKVGIRPISFAYPESDSNDGVMRKVKAVYPFDRSDCRVWGGYGFTVADGIAHLDEAVDGKEWLYCMLHGVGEDTWGPVDPAILDGLASYLNTHRDTIWTDTYGRVSSYIQKRNTAEIALRDIGDDAFDVRISLPDDRDYSRMATIPLTIKIALEGRNGDHAIVSIEGHRVESRVSSCGDYLLFDQQPDGTWVNIKW